MIAAALACTFGVPHLHHHPPPVGTGLGCLLCAAEGDRLEEQFWSEVAAGKYDAQGYTPAERRANVKRVGART